MEMFILSDKIVESREKLNFKLALEKITMK